MGRDQLFQGQARPNLMICGCYLTLTWEMFYTGLSISIAKSRTSLVWPWKQIEDVSSYHSTSIQEESPTR